MQSSKPPRREWLGDGMTALCGGALGINLLLVVGLLVVLAVNGLGFFWQGDLLELELHDGQRVLGEVFDRKERPSTEANPDPGMRLRLRSGNRDLTGADFAWIDEDQIASRAKPSNAVLIERLEWGNFYGYAVGIRRGNQILASTPEQTEQQFPALHKEKVRQRDKIRHFEEGDIGAVNRRIDKLRLQRLLVERRVDDVAVRQERLAVIQRDASLAEQQFDALSESLFAMREELVAEELILQAADGSRTSVAVGEVVRLVRPNAMGSFAKFGLYISRIWEFISADPRESNTEGGIFPAIFGTVMMVFIMSFAVAPLGVLAALYLREYAKQGVVVRLVRIAVNNLAGVPSIVFGVFGLGFFVYLIGGSLDRLFYPEVLPAPTYGTGGILWASLTLALLTVPVVIVATEEGLAAVPRAVREGSLALGATRFETMSRVVVPAAAPGILTGMILAMGRAAGEVAPLMIVGMVKLAPSLPIDGQFPFVHLERKFMHMGFHIYDVGFQSPNVEATKPMVFATALLLIAVVTAMNLLAVAVRNHLRAKYATSAV